MFKILFWIFTLFYFCQSYFNNKIFIFEIRLVKKNKKPCAKHIFYCDVCNDKSQTTEADDFRGKLTNFDLYRTSLSNKKQKKQSKIIFLKRRHKRANNKQSARLNKSRNNVQLITKLIYPFALSAQ